MQVTRHSNGLPHTKLDLGQRVLNRRSVLWVTSDRACCIKSSQHSYRSPQHQQNVSHLSCTTKSDSITSRQDQQLLDINGTPALPHTSQSLEAGQDEIQMMAQILDDVAEKGWAVCPGFLKPQLVKQLRDEADQLWETGGFAPAQVGAGGAKKVLMDIRGDQIHWLSEEALPTGAASYWTSLDSLRQDMNRYFYLSMRRFEGHFAVYPAGSKYSRHVDQFIGSRHRILSVILYLNDPDWQESDGGVLRIYTPCDAAPTIAEGNDSSNPCSVPQQHGNGEDGEDSMREMWNDVIPFGGTLVVFRSESTPHEVLPASRSRYSLAGWLRDDDFVGL